MLRKILLGSVLFAATTSFASMNPAPYLGANIGVVVNTGKKDGDHAYFRGMPINIVGGFGGLVDQNFYLAGEVFGTVYTGPISDAGLKTTYGWGVSALPGVMLSDHTLGFARIGAIWSQFSAPSKTAVGGQIGVGLQTTLTQDVDLRGEYDYSIYSSNNLGNLSNPHSDLFTLGIIYKFD
jgi:opacity protein-like surface antigen